MPRGPISRLALGCALLVPLGCVREAGGAPLRSKRVACASANAVDYLAWLGALDRIAICPTQADRYAFARVPPTVPRMPSFHAEPVLDAGAGLVICDFYQRGPVTEALERAGARVVVLDPVGSLAEIEANLIRVARALGLPVPETPLAHPPAQPRGRRPRVLVVHEGGTGPFTAGKGTVESLTLRLAGCDNVAEDWGVRGHAPLSVERALVTPCDYVLVAGERGREMLLASPAWSPLAPRIVVVEPRTLAAASPYVVEAAAWLRERLGEHR